MSKHTPEPWSHHKFNVWGDVDNPAHDGDSPFIATLWDKPKDEQLANAERIVKCVNACVGLGDPRAYIVALRRENAEAFALIQESNLPNDQRHNYAVARAARLKLEGAK